MKWPVGDIKRRKVVQAERLRRALESSSCDRVIAFRGEIIQSRTLRSRQISIVTFSQEMVDDEDDVTEAMPDDADEDASARAWLRVRILLMWL